MTSRKTRPQAKKVAIQRARWRHQYRVLKLKRALLQALSDNQYGEVYRLGYELVKVTHTESDANEFCLKKLGLRYVLRQSRLHD